MYVNKVLASLISNRFTNLIFYYLHVLCKLVFNLSLYYLSNIFYLY